MVHILNKIKKQICNAAINREYRSTNKDNETPLHELFSLLRKKSYRGNDVGEISGISIKYHKKATKVQK